MMSEEQFQAKLQKVKTSVDTFLSNDNYTIEDVASITQISSSSVQRYLNDISSIEFIYGVDAKETLIKLRERLNKNKDRGLSQGGIISTTNNEPIRDENGKFTGNKRR